MRIWGELSDCETLATQPSSKKLSVKDIDSIFVKSQKTREDNYKKIEDNKSSEFQRVVLKRPGNINEICLAPVEKAALGPHDVKILVKAFSLNFGDLLCVKGLYPTMPDYPFTPGFEVAGEVIQIGENVTKVKIGDEVIGLMGRELGGHSQVVTTEEIFVIKKPNNVTFEEACSFPVAFVTVHHVFKRAAVKKGEKILIQTAAGGVGLIAVQYAIQKGLDVLVTAGSEEKLEYLRGLGVTKLINYREEDFEQRVMEITNGKGVNVVINTLSGEAIQKGINILAPGGRYMEIAMTALKAAHNIDLSAFVDNQVFYSVDVRKLISYEPEVVNEYLEDMYNILAEGKIRPTVGKVFALDQIKEAYKCLELRQNIGKVVVVTKAVKCDEIKVMPVVKKVNTTNNEQKDVAIIGMSCRFAGAKDKSEFWNNLISGKNSITEFPQNRYNNSRHFEGDASNPEEYFYKHGGFLEDIDLFDPLFFNMSGKEAEMADPQQRILLEECWNALEDAGCTIEELSNKKCGVFVGVGQGDYQANMKEFGVSLNAQSFIGNSSSVSAARIAYFLNLKGPCIAIDTACSSSIIALHEACANIRTGECEMALAGGAFIATTPSFFIMASNAGMLSPDGQCKSFDNSANGFVPGEGVSVVVLKSLKKALEDGDNIYGIIKGSGMNQDGKTNGITAPSTLSQTELELSVYEKYGIHPDTISYAEAHGTGTKLGDPIEIEALTNAFRKYTQRKSFCAIGSVKTNIGHTVMSAGTASVIKVLLSLKNDVLPPSLNYNKPNEHINFEDSPFYVNISKRPWLSKHNEPRRALVSSFGFSGTNGHLVIEEAPPKENVQGRESSFLVLLSARRKESLNQKILDLLQWLQVEGKDENFRDICYTLHAGRSSFQERYALVVKDRTELINKLNMLVQGVVEEDIFTYEKIDIEENTEISSVAEILNGLKLNNTNKMEYEGALKKLAKLYVSGEEIDWRCIYVDKAYKISLPTYPFLRKRYWFQGSKVNTPSDKIHSLIDKIDAISSCKRMGVVFEKTLYENNVILRDHIVNGKAILPAAAQIEMVIESGMELGNSLQINLLDTKFILPIIIKQEKETIKILWEKSIDSWKWRIVNEEENITYSQGKITDKYSESRKLQIFHIDEIKKRCQKSYAVDKMYEDYAQAGIIYGPFYKKIKELWIGSNEALSLIDVTEEVEGGYVFPPNLLDAALQTIAMVVSQENEVMNKKLLVPFAFEQIEIITKPTNKIWTYVRKNQNGNINVAVLNDTGELCLRIHDIVLKEYYKTDEKLSDQYYYVPQWESLVPKKKVEEDNEKNPCKSTLIFHNDDGTQIANSIISSVSNRNNCVLFNIEAQYLETNDLALLYSLLENNHIELNNISEMFYICTLESIRENELELCDRTQEYGVIKLFRLLKMLSQTSLDTEKISVKIITNNTFQVKDESIINPYFSTLYGLAGSFAKENPNWKIGCIDIDIVEKSQIISYIHSAIWPENGDVFAIRNNKTYIRTLVQKILPKAEKTRFRENGVYVILGGRGGIGRTLGRYLAEEYKARIVIVGRSDEIESSEFIQEIRKKDGNIIYIQADIGNELQMREVMQKTKQYYGVINGVIHSALVLEDKLLRNMSEDTLRKVLWPKVFGTVMLKKVFAEEQLDFMLFFSSAQSFARSAGQSNYSAACTFKDSFASFIKYETNCNVKIVNWGYWGETGVVSDDKYKKNLIRTGLTPITNKEGLETVERVLCCDLDQVVAIKAKDNILTTMGREIKNEMLITPKVDSEDKWIQLINSVDKPKNQEQLQNSTTSLVEFGKMLLLYSLDKMGLFRMDFGKYKLQELKDDLKVISKYNRLFSALTEIIEQLGIWDVIDDNVIYKREAQIKTIEQLATMKNEILAKYPDFAAHTNLLYECILSYPQVLTGYKSYVEVMFNGGSKSLVEGVYKGNEISDYYNHLVAQIVKASVENKKHKNEVIRIVEIGAGTGGTSKAVLEALETFKNSGVKIEYYYTDISAGFTKYGQQIFGAQYPYIIFRTLNIEKDIEKQGYDPHTIDIIFASNVIHATSNITNTLQNTKKLLKNQGIFLINELSNRNDIATFTFGLTDGWWGYEDEEMRIHNSPLLEHSTWKLILEKEGFDEVNVYGFPSPAESGQCIIMGTIAGSTHKIELGQSHRDNLPVNVNRSNKVEDIKKKTIDYVKTIFASVLNINKEDIDTVSTLEKYGIDSLISVEINKQFIKDFGAISNTLLFEYNSVGRLATYFIDNYQHRLVEIFEGTKVSEGFNKFDDLFEEPTRRNVGQEKKEGNLIAEESASEIQIDRVLIDKQPIKENEVEKHKKTIVGVVKDDIKLEYSNMDIAIIEIEGRYPMAEDLEEFWENLKCGKNCIREIPKDRWNWQKNISENYKYEEKNYSKWGGFIENIDCFDTMFFHIAPKDAENMDPQERLFLECTSSLLEKAGMTRKDFNRINNKVGVFVGVMNSDYSQLGVQPSYWSISNRVSYIFDFQGPSMTIDTACSSSLTALHLACQSLKTGECKQAVAGGVNIILHPKHFSNLCSMNMLAKDNQCKSFGAGADGFVDGEGVGAILLKPLKDAVRDGDTIYGIVKGSSINAGGKTSGYTVPNPNAQADLITDVSDRAGISLRTISYIEAHGTGTALGDPIEISGLNKAFSTVTEDKQFCAVGSVKSNIGHLEAAAGIVAITKVLLQMKYGKLVPSINADEINPKINFQDTAFYLQKDFSDWERPQIKENGRIVTYPRRAGISSFGAGGANAHIILEEYIGEDKPFIEEGGNQQLFVISAKTKQQLQEYIQKMYDFLTKNMKKEQFNNTDIKKLLATKLEEVAGKVLELIDGEIDGSEDLQVCGFNTFKFSQFAQEINKIFGLELTVDVLIENNTIQSLAQYIIEYHSTIVGKYFNEDSNGVHTISPSLLAYTLQTAREAFGERIAVVYKGIDDLIYALANYKKASKEKLVFTKENYNDDEIQFLSKRKNDINYISEVINRRDWDKIADLWVFGADVDWSILYEGKNLHNIALPTYPFEKRRCWIQEEIVPTINTQEPSPNMIETTSKIKLIKNNYEKKQSKVNLLIPESDILCEEVTLEIINEEIALVTMKDRKNRNMFTINIIKGLISVFSKINNNEKIKAVVITGCDNVFSMGGTFEELTDIANKKGSFTDISFIYKGLLECNVPVISAIQGHSVGGGFVFGLYADIIVMSLECVYSANFMKYGFTPGLGATYILKEKLGSSLASEMMFTSKEYSGEDLMKRGASFIFRSSEDVLKEALKIAKTMVSKPKRSLQLLKEELSGRVLPVLQEVVTKEREMHDITFTTNEVKERIAYYSNLTNRAESVPTSKEKLVENKLVLSGNTRKDIVVKKQDNIDKEHILDVIARIAEVKLHYQKGEMNKSISFSDLGADSISGVEIIRDINNKFDIAIEAAELYNYPTVIKLAEYVAKLLEEDAHIPVNETEVKKVENKSQDSRPKQNSDFIQLGLKECKSQESKENRIVKLPLKEETSLETIKIEIVKVLKKNLHLQEKEIYVDKTFNEMGVDSISAVEMIRDLNKKFSLEMEAVSLYNYPTIIHLTKYIQEQLDEITFLEKTREKPIRDLESKTDIIELLKDLRDGDVDFDELEKLIKEGIL